MAQNAGVMFQTATCAQKTQLAMSVMTGIIDRPTACAKYVLECAPDVSMIRFTQLLVALDVLIAYSPYIIGQEFARTLVVT